MSNQKLSQLIKLVSSVTAEDPMEFIFRAVEDKVALLQQQEEPAWLNTHCPKTGNWVCGKGKPCQDHQCYDGWDNVPF